MLHDGGEPSGEEATPGAEDGVDGPSSSPDDCNSPTQPMDSILDWKEDEGPHADLSERSRRYLQMMEKPTFLYRYLKFELDPEPELTAGSWELAEEEAAGLSCTSDNLGWSSAQDDAFGWVAALGRVAVLGGEVFALRVLCLGLILYHDDKPAWQ